MSKRPNDPQLDLDLSGKGTEKCVQMKGSASVVHFVDAGTMRLRQDAVRRIVASGIFALHPGLRND